LENEIVLRFNPTFGTIKVQTHAGGIISHKEITNETLVQCLQGSLRRPAFFSGLLPENCVSFYAGEDDSRTIGILHPARRANITYYDTCYHDLPVPRLVFKFTLRQGLRVQTVEVGVVEEGRLKPDSKMYLWPFSNVSGYRMCIGSNIMPKCESLHTLSSLPYHILEIPNNNDHFQAKNNKLQMECRDLLEYLKDKEPDYYYDKVLVPSGRKLMDFIKVD